ncbi:MAG: type II toxin-antitoxin system VapC family toxin [Candidatus Binatia bacterium]
MIFVDTGAWFAVAVGNDPDHEAAMRWLRRNREPLITTDYVLAETATLIRMCDKTARGHRLALRVASSILRQQSAVLQNVTVADLQRGATGLSGLFKSLVQFCRLH